MKFRLMLAFAVAFLIARAVVAQSNDTAQQAPGLEQPKKIYVDENCRIHDVPPSVTGGKPHIYTDRGICDVGTPQVSFREETDYVNNKRKERTIMIREHTFSLHNPTQQETTFVVEQRLHKGWQIDSDPQPHEIEDGVAVFLVKTEAGQSVDLHVGERNPPKR